MATVNLSIITPQGVEVPLASSPWDAGTYHVLDGTAGLGFAPSQAYMTESAGDGRRVTNVRLSGRQINLQIGIYAPDRLSVSRALDDLADYVSYIDGLPLPRLRASYPDRSAREIEVFHVGGGEEGLTSLGEQTATVTLELEAPTAWWVDAEATAFTVSQSNDGVGFLESLPNVWLQSSSAFGDLTLRNPGKTAAWVDWELRGPFTQIVATHLGRTWTFTDDVEAGETIFIRRTPAGITVTDATAASRYSALGDVPQFWELPPGESRASIVVTGATPSTKVIGRFRPRYRQVF